MKHKVTNAELVCIDTTRPYSDGGSYEVEKGKTAIVKFLLIGKEVAVPGPCRFKVTHHGEVRIR